MAQRRECAFWHSHIAVENFPYNINIGSVGSRASGYFTIKFGTVELLWQRSYSLVKKNLKRLFHECNKRVFFVKFQSIYSHIHDILVGICCSHMYNNGTAE